MSDFHKLIVNNEIGAARNKLIESIRYLINYSAANINISREDMDLVVRSFTNSEVVESKSDQEKLNKISDQLNNAVIALNNHNNNNKIHVTMDDKARWNRLSNEVESLKKEINTLKDLLK